MGFWGTMLTSALFTFSAHAKILEVRTTAEALTHVDKETLLVFDLDNTVVMPKGAVGSEEWFDHLFAKYKSEAIEKGQNADAAHQQSLTRALSEWEATQSSIEVLPVETEAPGLIRAKQAQGVAVMALTARPATLVQTTARQLSHVGIEFTKTPISPKPFSLPGLETAHYEGGIVFSGSRNAKGDTLAKTLDHLALKPRRVVFVDNKRHHLETVEKALKGRKIEYVGCRLGAADAKIAAFEKANRRL